MFGAYTLIGGRNALASQTNEKVSAKENQTVHHYFEWPGRSAASTGTLEFTGCKEQHAPQSLRPQPYLGPTS